MVKLKATEVNQVGTQSAVLPALTQKEIIESTHTIKYFCLPDFQGEQKRITELTQHEVLISASGRLPLWSHFWSHFLDLI